MFEDTTDDLDLAQTERDVRAVAIIETYQTMPALKLWKRMELLFGASNEEVKRWFEMWAAQYRRVLQ